MNNRARFGIIVGVPMGTMRQWIQGRSIRPGASTSRAIFTAHMMIEGWLQGRRTLRQICTCSQGFIVIESPLSGLVNRLFYGLSKSGEQ